MEEIWCSGHEQRNINWEHGRGRAVGFRFKDWSDYQAKGSNIGTAITAEFEFDVPVRFDTDSMDLSMNTAALGNWGSIPIIEVRV